MVRRRPQVTKPWEGSGTEIGPTLTVALMVVSAIPAPNEMSAVRLKMSTVVDPWMGAENLRVTKVPLPDTPETGPLKESAIEVMVPPTLSIIPAKKKVDPRLGRKAPSLTDSALRTVGSKPISNWY